MSCLFSNINIHISKFCVEKHESYDGNCGVLAHSIKKTGYDDFISQHYLFPYLSPPRIADCFLVCIIVYYVRHIYSINNSILYFYLCRATFPVFYIFPIQNFTFL